MSEITNNEINAEIELNAEEDVALPVPSPEGLTYLRRLQLSIKRYLLISTGIATTALGLAVVVSFLAVAFADLPRHGFAEVGAAEASEEFSSPISGPSSPQALREPASVPPLFGPRSPALTRDAGSVPLGRIHNVNITFYDCADQGFCGAMFNGRAVYEGAAACSWNLPIGTKFSIVGDPTNRVYICEDRGLLSNTWVDIFWYYPADGYSWQSLVGRYGTIEIVN